MKEKRLACVNLGNFGSTGTIMHEIAEAAQKQGWQTVQYFPRDAKERPLLENDRIILSDLAKKLNQRFCRYSGFNGCGAWLATRRLLRALRRQAPTVLHLHNLHNSYVNLPMLFRFIKKQRLTVVWTLHDCWAFTGQCPYFDLARCDKWKTGCGGCPQYKNYPESAYDNTKRMYALKKKWFTGVENLTVVTPSQWLADLTKESYLKDYPVQVIHNGINLEVFTPTQSDFREKHGILEDEFLLLGVAFGWGKRKGLDVFTALADRLKGEGYRIVLVGTDPAVKKQVGEDVICIDRTNNKEELVQIYSAADLLVNPTREENYPTVNMEAIACGTGVLTFRTGGSPEIPDETCGAVVDLDDVDAMEREIRRIRAQRPFSREACLQRAQDFDKNEKNKEYVKLYEDRTRGTQFPL